jgi:hypothetical protein
MNIRELAEKREALRDEKRAIAEREKALNGMIAEIDTQLFDVLDEQGVDRLSTNGVTLSVTETVVPQVTDWNEVYAYVNRTGAFHLFERRMSSVAFRELLDRIGQVPGVESFTKRAISMRVSR